MRCPFPLLLVAVALALAGPVRATDPFASEFAAGLSAYERGDYPAALDAWRPIARQGHAKARFHLGVMYLRGEGVARDESRSREWFDFAGASDGERPAGTPPRTLAGAAPRPADAPAIHLGEAGALEGVFDLADVVAAYGQPSRREALDDEQVRHTWSYVGATLAHAPLPGAATSVAVAPTMETRVITGACRLAVVVAPGGGIVEAGAEGDACASVLGEPRAWRERHSLYLARPRAPRPEPRTE